MRVIFMGTPDFAVPSLEKLLERGDDVCAVFTQPDKPKGRGHKLQAPPVKELALAHNIPVYQPDTLRSEDIQAKIKALAPEAIIVAAYGKLLPKAVLDTPKFGCINVHGSLLPKYRGAAPIQWAVIHGEKTVGVTTMYMGEGMDTGDMLLKAETPLGEEETAGELFDRLKLLGADLLGQTLDKLERGVLERVPQNEEEATKAPMLTKELSQIDWTRPAQEIHDLIRGLNPWPGACATLDGKRLKLLASRVRETAGKPGAVVSTAEGMLIFCGDGSLLLTEIQTENGKRMSGKDYLLGHPLQKDAHLD
ncbi:methionyl-tRNA formyltransferase [uncultured Neglectibacter sp.]|uniref:methionyl-tRNA formyltransferase n=1 Tax=uncultured Neglectibacter sp. TaxID=1924108 RepID=UPI0034DFC0C8